VSSLPLTSIGRALHRPECVVGTPRGDVFVSDWRGGVTAIAPGGVQESWIAAPGQFELRPNGIAPADDGSFLIAHLGETGGVWRLDRSGRVSPVLVEVDGLELPPTNFVACEERRLWVSVSTRRLPRQQAWRGNVADGFVVLVDDAGARIVADGLHYTNEVRPDPSGRWLYVVETFGRRLVRFPVDGRGGLGPREIVVTFGHGWFPDGFAFDEAGGIWITSLISNRVGRFHDDRLDVVIEDLNTAYVDEVERAFAAGSMQAAHLGRIPGTTLQHVTSVTFGGPDRRTVSLGSLHGTCIYQFRADVPGAA
jgi:sugar lactone lactonase YvrE